MTSMQECDRLFSRVVRLRDRECQADDCGVSGIERLDCAHLVSRSYHRTRCDERKAVALCRGHHRYFTDRPVEWEQWCYDRFGLSFDLLRDFAIGKDLPLTYPRPDWTEIAAELRARLNSLEG